MAVGDGLLGEETAGVALRAEEAAVVDGQVPVRAPVVDGGEEGLQPGVEGGVTVAIGGADLPRGQLADGAGFCGDLLFQPAQAVLAVAARLDDGQQLQALGVEDEHQPVEEGERAGEGLLQEGVVQRGGGLPAAGVFDEATGEVGENLHEDALF